MRTEFPAGVIIKWDFGYMNGGRGQCFIYYNAFLTAGTGWLKSWLKKIVAVADYPDQVSILKELEEYLVFNIFRLTTEVKETFPAKQKTETLRINRELTAKTLELTTLKDRRKEARRRGVDGKFYYLKDAPSEFEIDRVNNQIKGLKAEARRLEAEGKTLSRTLKSCKANEAIIRERLEAMT